MKRIDNNLRTCKNFLKIIFSAIGGKVNLFEAVVFSNLDDIRLAAENGQNFDFFSSDTAFLFPLSLAVDLSQYGVIQVMLDNGADPNFEISSVGRRGRYVFLSDPAGEYFSNQFISRLLSNSNESSSTMMISSIQTNLVKVCTNDWKLTPTVLSLLMGDEYVLDMMYRYGGRLNGFYRCELIPFLFSNRIVMKSGICRLLLNNGDICPSLDHHLFSESVSCTFQEEILDNLDDKSYVQDFEECIEVFVQFGFSYIKNDLSLYTNSINILSILLKSRKNQTSSNDNIPLVRKRRTNQGFIYEICDNRRKRNPKRDGKIPSSSSSDDNPNMGWNIYKRSYNYSNRRRRRRKSSEDSPSSSPKFRIEVLKKEETESKSYKKKRASSPFVRRRMQNRKPFSTTTSIYPENKSKQEEEEEDKKNKLKKDRNYRNENSFLIENDFETTDVVGISSENSTAKNSPKKKEKQNYRFRNITKRGNERMSSSSSPLDNHNSPNKDEIWVGSVRDGSVLYILPEEGEVMLQNNNKNKKRKKKKGRTTV